ncbi:MAG: MFS transporter, partial [Acidimicrobiales bacterium]|nr:MFS transporter [Acidimicrobiales bacterium]
ILIYGRDSLALLLVGRLLLGAVSGAVLSVGTAWINELADTGATSRDRVHLASLITIMIYVGFGFGPITSALYDKVGPAPLIVPYLVHAGVTAAVLLGMWRLPETKHPDPTVSLRPQLGVPTETRRYFLTVLAPAGVWVFGFPSTSFALFPVILRDAIGGENDVLVAGLTGTVTAVAGLASRPISAAAGSTATGLVAAMWLGVVGYIIGTVAFITDLWQLIPVSAIALGAASGTLLTSGLAIIESIAEPSNRGALNATFYFAAYIGMAMPVAVTLLARVVSLNPALIAVTATAGLVALSTARAAPPPQPVT